MHASYIIIYIFYWFVYIFSYIYCNVKQNLKSNLMKAISICYACMLFICVCVGMIVALMCRHSLWWVFLFLFPISWTWIPLAELRAKIPMYPDFSTILLIIAFAVLCVLVSASLLLLKFDTFCSITCIVASVVAILTTMGLIMLIPRDETLKWT